MTQQEISTVQQEGKARLSLLFPTQVLSGSWPLAQQHGPALRDVILGRRAAQPISPSTLLAWQSDNDMVNWGGDQGRQLLDHVSRRADAATHDRLQQQKAPLRFNWSVEMWANVIDKLGSTQVHSHPGAYLTALCFVDDGYGGSDDPALGGELVFIDPRYPLVRMNTPDLRTRRPGGKVDQHEVRLRPRTGQILIFPSWLAHGFLPFHGPAPRVSVGINMAPRYAQ